MSHFSSGKFQPKLEESGQARVFYEIETPLLPVLVAMEREGIRLCESTLATTGESLAGHIAELETSIYAVAGREFNLNSPKQLGEVLFDELKLAEKPKKTKTVNMPPMNKSSLTSRPNTPLWPSSEYRQLTKLKSTYIDSLPNSIDLVTGRVHTHYGQAQTATGRLSSNDPNLQNIPVRSPKGREIRKHLSRAKDGSYSQPTIRRSNCASLRP